MRGRETYSPSCVARFLQMWVPLRPEGLVEQV